ncbi:hypothetical protein [Kribbella shirazensis]|uniref:hypothetical protein n=1 Tax=Kribbella shirazensis TaxID=1105143 RepID=UPI003B51AF63
MTTVRQDFGEVGRRCLEVLVRRIELHSDGTGSALVPAERIVRASTGRPDRRRKRLT